MLFGAVQDVKTIDLENTFWPFLSFLSAGAGLEREVPNPWDGSGSIRPVFRSEWTELLAATLPNDLAQYVVEDIEAFQKKIVELTRIAKAAGTLQNFSNFQLSILSIN